MLANHVSFYPIYERWLFTSASPSVCIAIKSAATGSSHVTHVPIFFVECIFYLVLTVARWTSYFPSGDVMGNFIAGMDTPVRNENQWMSAARTTQLWMTKSTVSSQIQWSVAAHWIVLLNPRAVIFQKYAVHCVIVYLILILLSLLSLSPSAFIWPAHTIHQLNNVCMRERRYAQLLYFLFNIHQLFQILTERARTIFQCVSAVNVRPDRHWPEH